MFQQALNTSVYMTITFVLFLLCTLFLVWCNHSIDAAGYLRGESTIDRYHQWRGKSSHLIFWPFEEWYVFQRGGAISNLLRNGRGWWKWLLKTNAKGEGWSKKPQIECYVTVNLCSFMFLLQDFTITYLSDGVRNRV